MTTRRIFLKNTSLAGLALAGGLPATAAPQGEDLFKLGIAGYSFVHFKLDESLAMMKKLDVHYLCIKDFHLPYASTDAEIAAFHAKLAQSGVTGYAVGPIYMKTTEEIDNAFAYAKRVGVKLMIGIPNPEHLPYVDKKVREYDIRYAIHNHGPGDKLYPNAITVYNLVKNLDARIGLCFDMGHDKRYGDDPVTDLEKYASRIFDIHLKNVTAGTKDGTTCELSRGVIDITAFVRVLRKVKYAGCCSLEYEKDMKDPLAGLAESVGYFKGICTASQSSSKKS
ncbi:MAG: sugar phosphate isomerase/epimerase [Siphonobacter aquaeclarae]|nr:sugar phosphate isomerase/epimerase [Siphonobacter aquaeclarae]